MPRAKRTNRAEARRRYRASIGEPIEEEAFDDAEPQAAARSSAPKTPGATQERPSLSNAFRAAFRPPNVREDLRALPRLLVDRSVWLPSLLTVAAGIAFAVTGGGNWLIALVATYFVAPPALGSVFLGGFLAPRASYLVGLIIGFVSAVVASAVILTSSASLVTGQPIVGTPTPTPVSSPAASGGRFSVPRGRLGGSGFAGPVRFGCRVTDAVGLPIADTPVGAGPGHLRVPDVADLRHVLRRVGRLVPALPAPVEPEPRAPAAAAARSGRPFPLEPEPAPLSARA